VEVRVNQQQGVAARVPRKVSSNTTKPLHDYLDATNYTQLHPQICSAHIKQSPPPSVIMQIVQVLQVRRNELAALSFGPRQ